MVFFAVKKDFSIDFNNNQINLNFLSSDDKLTPNHIYISSILETDLITRSTKDDILYVVDANKALPLINSKELGASYQNQIHQMLSSSNQCFDSSFEDIQNQISSCNKKSISIALIGCFGGGIGDLVSAMPAFRIFTSILKQKFDDIYIDIYTHLTTKQISIAMKYFFDKEAYIRVIKALPMSVETLNKYDFYIDTIFFMQDSKSKKLPIVDLALHKLGIEHKSVHKEDKLYNLRLKEDISSLIELYIKQKAGDKTVVLFHPKSSSQIRSIPEQTSYMLLNLLLEDEDIFVVSANNISSFTHDRFLDMSVLSLSYEHFFSIINAVDFCISSDTCVYHIAGNLNTPSIAFFTTIEPSLRIKYYKNTYSIYIENEQIKNLHNENEQATDIDMAKIFNDFDVIDFMKKVDTLKHKIRLH